MPSATIEQIRQANFPSPPTYDRMQQIAEVIQRRLGIDDPNDLESWLASKDAEHGEVY